VLEAIINFLFEKEVAVIHLLIVAIFSPLIYRLLKVFSIVIWKAIKKTVKTVYEYMARINRFRNRKITIRDYKNIVARLECGSQLRWYEKEAFYEAKKQWEGSLRETVRGLGLDFSGVAERLNLKAPQILHIKESFNRPDGEDNTHDKEDA
jgi:hypothetical protein